METSRVLALMGSGVALVSIGALAFSGIGTRLGFWEFRTGFTVMRYAAYAGLAGAALSLLTAPFVRGPLLGLVLVGIAVGALTAWLPWEWSQKAGRLPVIHDITTDTENPPVFNAILPLRQDAPNSAQYGGAEVAAQQRKAYPNVRPAVLPGSQEQAYAKALEVARAMGWRIVNENPASGVFEATDTTLWYGFKDDVVVRVTGDAGGSRVDVRSVSRVGRSDVGTNAARIEKYLAKLGK